MNISVLGTGDDRIKSAYHASKNIYDNVLTQGSFLSKLYIKGKSGRTDWLVKNILTKKGWFTPPFLTEENLLKVLHKLYSEVECHTDGSIAYFKCRK